jgi:integrase
MLRKPQGLRNSWTFTTAFGEAHGAVIRMLLLTGQRLNEVAQMSWSIWSLPRERCKNGHAHVVPLSNQALAIISPRQGSGESDLVFGVSGFSRAKKALDTVAKLSTPWCVHDLRRTCASGMARLGVAPHVVEAVYNRYSYSTEKREALDLWAEHVTRCAGNIIVARPVEARAAETAALSELEAA